jgi:hypothetical protein
MDAAERIFDKRKNVFMTSAHRKEFNASIQQHKKLYLEAAQRKSRRFLKKILTWTLRR